MDDAMHKGGHRVGLGLAFNELKDMSVAWRSVLPLAKLVKRAKGEEVPQGKEMMFLERGKVRLVFHSPEGAEKIIWFFREGSLFGVVPFMDPIPNEGVFICATDCVYYTFSKPVLERLSKERPDLMLDLLRYVARKVRILTYHASSLSLDDMLVRICKFLFRRIVPGSNPLRAKIGMPRQEMASLLGMHRISMYKVLRQQEESGLFGSVRGNTITILRPEEFYKLAGY